MFEQAPNAAALPCYVDDERNISQVITTQLREAGYIIDGDALHLLSAQVLGDRAVARSEAQKLITYMGGPQEPDTPRAQQTRISFEDVSACCGDGAILSFDDLTRATAGGFYTEADRVLTQLLSEGLPPVTLLRTLQNHFTRLHLTQSRIASGLRMEQALAQLRPPLFFKVKNAFIAQLRIWRLADLDRALEILREAEMACKSTGLPAETICARAVFTLAMAARRLGSRRAA